MNPTRPPGPSRAAQKAVLDPIRVRRQEIRDAARSATRDPANTRDPKTREGTKGRGRNTGSR